MSNIFLISDTHFGDIDFYSYKLEDGTLARPFKNHTQADEYMVEKWNSIVGPNDKVYHLGDLGEKKALKIILPKLNGKKVLIKGNHDKQKMSFYSQYFYDIRAYHYIDKILMSHIPVHPYCKGKFLLQAHGHTHTFKMPNKFYYNCCVENHDYSPIPFEDIKKYVENNIDNIWSWCYNDSNIGL